MFFLQTNACCKWIESGLTRKLSVAAFVLGNASLVQVTAGAQTTVTGDERVESGYVAEACPHVSNPNGLKAVALKCAQSLTSDANCRVYTNFRTDDRTVEKYAIIKDCAVTKPFGYLLVPTEPIVGVESSKIFSPSFVNLWSDAWLWSKKFPARPSSQIGLAINSNLPGARSQNQFHIHISCASSDVRKMLEERNDISRDPAQAVLLTLGMKGHQYYAVKVVSLTGSNSPFVVAKMVLKSPANNLSGHGIAVIGSRNADEYYILISASERGNPGDAEELLDESCKDSN